MPNKFRWEDAFTADPFSDPAYSITSGSAGWTYNGTTDRLENSTAGAVSASVTLLDSNHGFGVVEADLAYFYSSSGSNQTAMCLRAFGYWLVLGENGGAQKFLCVFPEETDPASGLSDIFTASEDLSFKIPYFKGGESSFKIISTPSGVDFFVDNILEFTLQSRSVASNVRVLFHRTGGGSGGTSFVSRLSAKADSSLPKAITITTPGLTGGLASTTGPITLQTPQSRLYLDLGSLAGRIGSGGLTNVVYDPGGANVSMTEDTGISDISGGTTGDYYLECPVRGVASDYRLVLKEAFVTANSVVVTDQIDFDVAGGPTGQSGLVKQEDDLHCYVEKHTVLANSREDFKEVSPNATSVLLHNANADGNDAFIVENGPRSRIINGTSGGSAINGAGKLRMNGVTYPVIFDLDFTKVRNISKIVIVYHATIDTNLARKNLSSFDIYVKDTPFSGASLAQGTLIYDNYSPPVISEPINGPIGLDLDYYKAAKGFSDPEISIKSRYVRLVINSDNGFGSGTTDLVLCRQLLFFEKTNLSSMNSSDDNAQFEYDSGSGFGVYPAGGVTQGVGNVRITLPTSLEHDGNSPNFYKIYFKPDITD